MNQVQRINKITNSLNSALTGLKNYTEESVSYAFDCEEFVGLVLCANMLIVFTLQSKQNV